MRLPRFTGQRIRDKNSISSISAKRPPSPKPVPGPVPIPAPAPPPVQRVPLPKYDATFRQDAVRCWLDSGKPAHVVAAELGIKADRLYAWRSQLPSPAVQAAQSSSSKSPSHADLRSQLDATLAELRRVSEQRDILKKTLGILSEHRPSASNGFTR